MALMELSQARVFDPVLTSLAYGIQIPDYVGHLAFPPVYVDKRGVKVIRFGDNDEYFLYPTRRAPGTDVTRVEAVYGDVPIELYQDAIEGKLTREMMQESRDMVNMEMRTLRTVKRVLSHRIEYDQLSLLGLFSAYATTNRLALTSGSQISDAGTNVVALFDAANMAVLQGIGKLPNTIIYGGLKAFNAVKENPRIRDQIKYTDKSSVTLEMLNGILGYPTGAICLSQYSTVNAPTVRVPMFDNSIWVGYVAREPDNQIIDVRQNALIPTINSDRAEPSFGYTYLLNQADIGADDGTGLIMEQAYWDPSSRSYYFPGIADRVPVTTGMNAGYLLTNVAA